MSRREEQACVGILLLVLAVVLWDLWVIWCDRWDETVSARLLADARQNPIAGVMVGIVIGVLIGHFYWPQR